MGDGNRPPRLGATIATVAPAKAGARKRPLVCARLRLEAGFRRHDVGDG